MTEETRKIIEYKRKFLDLYRDTQDQEIREMVDHIERTDHFYMMNCDLQYDYDRYVVSYGYDSGCNLPYVIEHGNKIYFPRKYSETEVKWRFRALIREQDAFSPHKYLDDVSLKTIRAARNEGKKIITIEIGAMEGMFSLSLADISDELYLFECDKDWSDALKETFKPWNDKTTIYRKFVGEKTDDLHIALDDNCIDIENETNTFLIIKMDIEGNEKCALRGMRKLLDKSEAFLLFICTYHKKDDEAYVRKKFENCKIWSNAGYFCFYVADDYEEPFIRRCVLKIKKRK